MTYWETADRRSSAPEHELEFARIWKETPKVVFSNPAVGGAGLPPSTFATGAWKGSPPKLYAMREIEIAGEVIRLGQLLKLSALVGSGGEARAFLLAGGVTVNGEPEARRGRQLHRGDVVVAAQHAIRVV